MTAETTCVLECSLPSHKASLRLVHNEHRDLYQSAENWSTDNAEYLDWVSEEQRQKAIDTNSVWVLHWYPDTPVGFYVIAGADLAQVLARAKEIEEEDRRTRR